MEIEKARDLFKDHVRNGSFLGLDRIKALMCELGDPQDKLRFIHIAGTNGKGSTAAMLESVLRASGYSTGMYTSPALSEFNERIRYNGENIADEELTALLPQVIKAAGRVKKSGFETVSEFEFVTALGFLYFKEKKADIVILEVGLGGRLDATNVISSPEAAVITAIGFDHMDRLGSTLAEIAGEKAAIIKPGCAVVSYDQPDEARIVISAKAKESDCDITFAENKKISVISKGISGSRFDYKKHKNIKIPLAGEYQLYNAALALETLDVLTGKGYSVTEDSIAEGLASIKWNGRLQVLREDPPVLLDGAHNEHGVRALFRSLTELLPGEKFIFVCGMMSDKQIGIMLEIPSSICEYMITLAPENNPRATDSKTLAGEAEKYCKNVYAASSLTKALDRALDLQKKTGLPVCCYGTLYMSGDIQKYFKERSVDTNE